jgi:hypothetical protein
MSSRNRFPIAWPARLALWSLALASIPSPAPIATAADPAGKSAKATADASKSPFSTFEGVLHVHPKFLYHYYIVGQAEGQHFALFDTARKDRLFDIPPGSTIEVTGRLGTRFHPGGTDANPSPFTRCWYVYMDVSHFRVLRAPDPLPKSDKNTPAPVSLPPGAVLPGTVLPNSPPIPKGAR